ncbi:MAG: helix-turn-helix transcriptional regulator [Lachnospiraceae bacterium]
MDKNFIAARFQNKKLITQLFTVLIGFSILLMFVVSIVVSHQTNASFFHNNNLIYSNTIEVSMQTLDTLLSGHHDSLTHITYDVNIIDFVVTPKPRESSANYQVWSVLNGYCQENEAIEEIYLYIKKTDHVLTSSYETSDLDSFREHKLISSHYSAPPLTSFLKSGRKTSLELHNNQIYMVRDFPLNGERSLGTLFMKINPTTLAQALSGSQTTFSYLFAYDNQWRPIFPGLLDYTQLPDEMKTSIPDLLLNGTYTKFFNNRHYFFITSEQSNIHMVLSVNDSYFTPSYQTILTNAVPFFILILILSTLLTAGILYLSYMPVLKLTRIVSSEKSDTAADTPENEWDYLTNHFLTIAQQKNQLDQVLNNMIPEISKEFYFDLLSGKPMDLPYIQNILCSIDSPIETAGTFSVIAVTFADTAQGSIKTEVMEMLALVLSERSPDFCHYVMQQMDESLYIIMLQFSGDTTTYQISKFEINMEQAFCRSLKGSSDLAWIEFGLKCTSLQNISVSYLECLQRQVNKKYASHTAGALRGDIQNDSVTLNYHYFQVQVKVIADYVMKGDSIQAMQKALQICTTLSTLDNPEEVSHTYDYYRMAFWDMLASYRITDTVSEELSFFFDKEFAPIQNSCDPSQSAEYMEQFCNAAVTLLTEKYQKQQHKYLIKARRYIEEYYSNPDLSLNLLAEQCKTTTSYLSRLFKESFGINFVDYLNQYRIVKAKELLQDPNQSIKDTAVMTGFNSQQNFIRVFKKYTGETPGRYKGR